MSDRKPLGATTRKPSEVASDRPTLTTWEMADGEPIWGEFDFMTDRLWIDEREKPMSNETTADALRTLADLLEANPDLMDKVGHVRLLVPVQSPDEMARYASMIGGHRRKTDNEKFFGINRVIGPRVSIEVFGAHDEVCTRKVVGTETVEIPAVEASPARTETRDVIEWVCPPVRGEAS